MGILNDVNKLLRKCFIFIYGSSWENICLNSVETEFWFASQERNGFRFIITYTKNGDMAHYNHIQLPITIHNPTTEQGNIIYQSLDQYLHFIFDVFSELFNSPTIKLFTRSGCIITIKKKILY